MAAKDSNTVEFEKQELDDTISCCICLNVYTDPKALPCIHTFCMNCLQEIGLKTNKGPGDEMPCPICRRQFKIPQEGFHGLPSSFFIPKMLHVTDVPDSSASSIPLCDACPEVIQKAVQYRLDPVLVQTVRTKAAKEDRKFIGGLTILDKELFVANDESSEVEVYDSMKLSFIRQWNLKELIDPKDMGSCNRNKCLYIFDFKGDDQSKEILRVDPNGKLTKSWSTGDDWGWGLSVTDESNVILAVFVKNKINEYSPDGMLIREINLATDSGGIRHPWHAIKLTKDHFLISQGRLLKRSGGDLHRVCVVDTDGKLKKSFGGKPGSAIGRMNFPFYLAVDGNGFVMVADFNNGRVLLLDSDLEFKREILSKGKYGVRGSQKILLDETNNRLFVADTIWDAENNRNKGGRILIFEFR